MASHDVEVGPIWDQADAERKAAKYEKEHPNKQWNSHWRTTVFGKMSVIGVRDRLMIRFRLNLVILKLYVKL